MSNIKIKNINKNVSSIIINEPKAYNSLSFKNLNDLKNDVILNANFRKLYNAFCPGPITFVLKKKKKSRISIIATAGKKTVAVRIPKHRVARDLLDILKFPLAAPSANISSKLLLIVALFQIFDGIQIVAQGALRGIQDVKIPSFICFLSYIIIGLPIMVYLALYTELKAVGVWIGFLIGLISASIFLSMRFFYMCNLNIKYTK